MVPSCLKRQWHASAFCTIWNTDFLCQRDNSAPGCNPEFVSNHSFVCLDRVGRLMYRPEASFVLSHVTKPLFVQVFSCANNTIHARCCFSQFLHHGACGFEPLNWWFPLHPRVDVVSDVQVLQGCCLTVLSNVAALTVVGFAVDYARAGGFRFQARQFETRWSTRF